MGGKSLALLMLILLLYALYLQTRGRLIPTLQALVGGKTP